MFNKHESAILQEATTQAFRPKEQETNTVGSEQLLLANSSLLLTENIRQNLAVIPTPDNPAHKSLLSFFHFSNWSYLLSYLSPAFLIPLWHNFFKSARRFYTANNQNWEQYTDLAVSTISAIGWTVLYVIGMGAIGAGLAKLAPYLLITLLGVKALAGVVNCFKNLYYAFTAKHSEERNQHLWNAAKQLVSVVTYTLGLVLTIVLGIEMNQAIDSMSGGLLNFLNGLKMASSLYVKAIPLLYGVICTALIGAAMDTKELNEQTWQAVQNPSTTLNNAWHKIRRNPLHSVPMIFNIALRTIALVFAPLQLFVYAVKEVANTLTPTAPTALTIAKAHDQDSEHDALVHDLKAQITKTANQIDNMGTAKHLLAKMLLTRINTPDQQITLPNQPDVVITTIDDMVAKCRGISKNVYSAFFSRKSQTEQLVERAKRYQSMYENNPKVGG